MADRESDNVRERTNAGDLSTPINSASLMKYLTDKFKQLVELGKLIPSFKEQDEEVIRELNSLGIDTIGKLDEKIPAGYIDNAMLVSGADTFLGLVRNILLIYDANTYFEKAWKEFNWNTLDRGSFNLIKSYNPNIENILRKYNIDIRDLIII